MLSVAAASHHTQPQEQQQQQQNALLREQARRANAVAVASLKKRGRKFSNTLLLVPRCDHDLYINNVLSRPLPCPAARSLCQPTMQLAGRQCQSAAQQRRSSSAFRAAGSVRSRPVSRIMTTANSAGNGAASQRASVGKGMLVALPALLLLCASKCEAPADVFVLLLLLLPLSLRSPPCHR